MLKSVFTLVAACAAASPVLAAELVSNGDFSSGASGFSSTYSTVISGATADQGSYAATTNPALICPSCFLPLGDHTTGTGNMLFVDGARSNAGAFWSQTFDVVANSTYALSLWATSLGTTGAKPTLSLQINGVPYVGPSELPYTTGATATTWSQFTASWSSGAATSVTLALFDTTMIYEYNDLAVDDISFQGPSPAAVPEPATWAMTIGGFGLIGSAMRRRRQRSAFA